MKFHDLGRAKAGRLLLLAIVAIGGLVIIQKDHWFIEGRNGLYFSATLIFVSALIIVIRYRRDPTQRAVFVVLFKDRKAMTFGAVWILLVLVTQFASHGLHDIFSTVTQALISGFAVAALWNWFAKRRNPSSS